MTLTELFDSPKKWVKGSFRCSAEGEDLPYRRRDEAVCWCLFGGIQQIAESEEQAQKWQEATYDALYKLTPFKNIPAFNDNPGTTYEQLLAVCQEAERIFNERS